MAKLHRIHCCWVSFDGSDDGVEVYLDLKGDIKFDIDPLINGRVVPDALLEALDAGIQAYFQNKDFSTIEAECFGVAALVTSSLTIYAPGVELVYVKISDGVEEALVFIEDILQSASSAKPASILGGLSYTEPKLTPATVSIPNPPPADGVTLEEGASISGESIYVDGTVIVFGSNPNMGGRILHSPGSKIVFHVEGNGAVHTSNGSAA